jgi:hypothetical protein
MCAKLLDREYFENYSGSGKSYDRVWSQYSYAKELTALYKQNPECLPLPKRVLILGAATGKVIETVEKRLGAKCWGCEINEWAYQKIPLAQRSRIKRVDMRVYVKELRKKGKSFDLTFSNSLIYLPKREIAPFLMKLSKLSTFLHFHSSRKGSACPDPYRQTLESYDWWNQQLQKSGFQPVKIPNLRRSYLWKSQKV